MSTSSRKRWASSVVSRASSARISRSVCSLWYRGINTVSSSAHDSKNAPDNSISHFGEEEKTGKDGRLGRQGEKSFRSLFARVNRRQSSSGPHAPERYKRYRKTQGFFLQALCFRFPALHRSLRLPPKNPPVISPSESFHLPRPPRPPVERNANRPTPSSSARMIHTAAPEPLLD